MGGRFSREGPYEYLWLIHVDVWQKITKFCKAIILQLKNVGGKKVCCSFLRETFKLLRIKDGLSWLTRQAKWVLSEHWLLPPSSDTAIQQSGVTYAQLKMAGMAAPLAESQAVTVQ